MLGRRKHHRPIQGTTENAEQGKDQVKSGLETIYLTLQVGRARGEKRGGGHAENAECGELAQPRRLRG